MKIGLVGKPNVGKSTFFRAATLKDVATGDYPFTTIDANVGVAHVRTRCPCGDLDEDCSPSHGECHDGTRFVPIQLVDVAGLVPGAHQGKGLGNKFLDDLRQADALVHVVDASGATDAEGNPVDAGTHDPLDDVRFLEDEVEHWIDGILADGWDRLVNRARTSGGKPELVLQEQLGGLGVSRAQIIAAMRDSEVARDELTPWGDEGRMAFSRALRRRAKPILVAFNKSDHVPSERVQELGEAIAPTPWVATSADSEVALRGAATAQLIDYEPGAAEFSMRDESKLNDKQRAALQTIHDDVLERHGGTGVLPALERTAFDLLDLIVAFPVEDESKWTDKEGRLLPDALLVPKGSTARDLAYAVHTDLGERFIRAIDGRTRRVVGADHELASGDVVSIVADA